MGRARARSDDARDSDSGEGAAGARRGAGGGVSQLLVAKKDDVLLPTGEGVASAPSRGGIPPTLVTTDGSGGTAGPSVMAGGASRKPSADEYMGELGDMHAGVPTLASSELPLEVGSCSSWARVRGDGGVVEKMCTGDAASAGAGDA